MPCRLFPASLFTATALTGITLLGGASALADQFEFFEKNIRPVLVENCYQCHSAESEKLKGELHLDSREGMLRGGATGPAIVPGNAEKSLLIKAIRRLDEDLAMPPKKTLPPEVIENFISWVNAGAPDPRQGKTNAVKATGAAVADTFWSFIPPKAPTIPKVNDPSWPKTPVDHFILASLEAKGLRPSSPAEKRTLIRRASFDLTGLPPTANEVNAFIRDTSEDAFAQVVERLLASPRYGERWGRYWLDVARYADNKGYVYGDREEGRFVHSHAYRDWVIKAFNDDMPYDRFLLLQLAADQVETNHSSYAAMGFLTLGRRFLGVMHDIIDDRIDTVTRAAQGLTVSCARCHDHKFDPISTRDYYSLYGIFAGSSEKTVPLFSEGPGPESAYDKELQKRVEKLNNTFQSKKEKLTDSLRKKVTDYLVAQLTADQLPSEEFYAIRGPDDLNPYIVRQWQAFLFNAGKEFHPVFAPWHAFAGLSEKEFASKTPDAWKALTNTHPNKLNPVVVKSFSTNFPSTMKAVAELYGRLFSETDLKWRQLVSATNTAGQKVNPSLTQLPDPSEEELRLVLYSPDSPVQVPNGAIVDLEWFFDETTRVELGKLQSEIDRWNIQSDAAPPYAVILEDRKNPRNARVFKRGNPANKGEEVPRQYLELISGKDRKVVAQGSGRLEMAQAITSPQNPLTARVMVNRIWLHHFGSGLVKTPSDFGTRSEPPSHPELLDYLACRFMNEGWSIKNLHRLLVLSQVYQQASDMEPEPTRALTGGGSVHAKQNKIGGRAQVPRDSASSALAEKLDPENRLLWRMNRQRLDFESMRDSLLAVSGELDPRMGGKPVEIFKTPAPRRRTVYGFVDRQFLPGILRVFDFANPDMHSPQRHHTTVPQQALFFMNSPFVVDRARALGVQDKKAKPQEAIRGYYRRLYQRDPTAAEVSAGLRFIADSAAEPPPEPPPPVVMQWKYGYGEFDTNAQRTTNFHELPHFTGEAWQGGPKWPDEKLGWVQLNREGGHTGNDLQHAAIRRWVAPYDAVVGISGQVKHERKEGDGIRARLISSRSGLLGTWTLHDKKEEAKVETLEVKKGDTLDFMVDLGGGLNNDDFKWTPIIKVNAAKTVNNPEQGYETEWEAKKEFSGPPQPPPKPLTPWEKYAQVLLLSNEFIFVD